MPTTPASAARPPRLFAALLLAALTVLTFAPGLDGPIVGVEARLALRDSPDHAGLASLQAAEAGDLVARHAPHLAHRPTLAASYAIDRLVCGPEPRCHHAGNLLLHVLAGWCLLLLLHHWLALPCWPARQRRDALVLAGAGAALWLVHPLQTTVVTYLPGRAEGLGGMLILASLAASVCWPRRWADAGTLVAVAAAWLAAGSDVSAVLLPFLALPLAAQSTGISLGEAARRRPLLHLGLAGAALAALYLAGLRAGYADASLLATWAARPAEWWQQIGAFVWPMDMHLSAGPPPVAPWWLTLAAVAGLGAGAALARRLPRDTPLAATAGSVALALLAPALFPDPVDAWERQAYLARAGMALGVVLLAATIARRRFPQGGQAAVILMTAALVLAGMTQTSPRLADYRDDVSFVSPADRDDAFAAYLAYLRDQPEAAQREWDAYRAAGEAPPAELVAVLRDTYLELARQHVDSGDEEAAVPLLERALELAPEQVDVRYDLGRILANGTDPRAGEAHLQATVALAPEHVDAHLCLAESLERRGDVLAAREHFATVRELSLHTLDERPDSAEAWCRLGRARRGLDQAERAVEAFDEALRRDPRLAHCIRARIETLLALGRVDEAQRDLAAARRLLPRDAELQDLEEGGGMAP